MLSRSCWNHIISVFPCAAASQCETLGALSGSVFLLEIKHLNTWLNGINVPLGSSYSKQTGILSCACWFLVQHLKSECKNLPHTACRHFWSSGYFLGTCRADCHGLSELDTGRIQLILKVKCRISGKDSCISSSGSAEVQDSLKIALKSKFEEWLTCSFWDILHNFPLPERVPRVPYNEPLRSLLSPFPFLMTKQKFWQAEDEVSWTVAAASEELHHFNTQEQWTLLLGEDSLNGLQKPTRSPPQWLVVTNV